MRPSGVHARKSESVERDSDVAVSRRDVALGAKASLDNGVCGAPRAPMDAVPTTLGTQLPLLVEGLEVDTTRVRIFWKKKGVLSTFVLPLVSSNIA